MLFYCCTGVNLVPMVAIMPTLQHRHEAPPQCGDMCQDLSSGLSGRWFHPSLAGTFSAQPSPRIVFCVVFRK